MINKDKFVKFIGLDTEHIIQKELISKTRESSLKEFILGSTAIGDNLFFTPYLKLTVKLKNSYSVNELYDMTTGEIINMTVLQLDPNEVDEELIIKKVKEIKGSKVQPFVYIESHVPDKQLDSLIRLENAIEQVKSGKQLDQQTLEIVKKHFEQVNKIFQQSKFASDKAKLGDSEFAAMNEMITKIADNKATPVEIANQLKRMSTLTELTDQLYTSYVKENNVMVGFNVMFDITKIKDLVNTKISMLKRMRDKYKLKTTPDGREIDAELTKLEELQNVLIERSKKISTLASESFTTNRSQIRNVLKKSIELLKLAQEGKSLDHIDLLPIVRSFVSYYNRAGGTEAGYTLTEAIKIFLSDVSTKGAHSAVEDVRMTEELAKYFLSLDYDEIEAVLDGKKKLYEVPEPVKDFFNKLKVYGNVVKTSFDMKGLKKLLGYSYRNKQIVEIFKMNADQFQVQKLIDAGLLDEKDLEFLGIMPDEKLNIKSFITRMMKGESIEKIVKETEDPAKKLVVEGEALKIKKLIQFVTIKNLSSSAKNKELKGRLERIIHDINEGVHNMANKIEVTEEFIPNAEKAVDFILEQLKGRSSKTVSDIEIVDLLDQYKHDYLGNVIEKELELSRKTRIQKALNFIADIYKEHPKTILGTLAVGLGLIAYMNRNKNREELIPGEYYNNTDIISNVMIGYQNAAYNLKAYIEKSKIEKKAIFQEQLLEYMRGKLNDNNIVFFKLRTSPDYKNLRRVPRINPHTIYRNRNRHREPLP